MIKTVLFDLDGTLLPMDLDVFIKTYMGALKKKFDSMGLDSAMCVKSVLAGTKQMYKNDGRISNEECFWNTFEKFSNIKKEDVIDTLDAFYKNEFPLLNICTEGRCENMMQAVSILKEKGYRLILATNPLFPALATKARIGWAGLDESMFDVITTYENCSFTKPNIEYFKALMNENHLLVEECMMVGNDSLEDGVIETIGIPLYLVEDYLIHREDTPLKSKWHGKSEDFLEFVNQLPYIK